MSTAVRIRNKELRELASLAHRQGWSVAFTNGGHLKFTPPDTEKAGVAYVITATTPSSRYSITKTRNDLMNAGMLMTLDAVKRAERAAKPNPTPVTPDQEAPEVWVCRHAKCTDVFPNRNLRDTHEELACKHKPPLVKVRPKKQCKFCPEMITAQNMSRHVAKQHAVRMPGSEAEPLEPDSLPPAAEVVETTTDITEVGMTPEGIRWATITRSPRPLMARLVDVVFPDGLPLEPIKLMAAASWIEQTTAFLAEVEAA